MIHGYGCHRTQVVQSFVDADRAELDCVICTYLAAILTGLFPLSRMLTLLKSFLLPYPTVKLEYLRLSGWRSRFLL
jgi:hypothetical protein